MKGESRSVMRLFRASRYAIRDHALNCRLPNMKKV